MKIVFLAREGISAHHIAAKIASRYDVKVIWETGVEARRRKLRRYFSVPIFTWPQAVLDLAAALLYSKIVGSAVERELGPAPHLSNTTQAQCVDANDRNAHAFLQAWKPDVVVVYGTALLNKKTLSLAPIFLNLHGGIVPHYRNVHSEFWALRERDFDRIGTSVLLVRPGVDDGEVVIQKSIAKTSAETVSNAVAANVRLAGEMALEALDVISSGRSKFTAQVSSHARVWPTPGFGAIVRALLFKNPPL